MPKKSARDAWLARCRRGESVQRKIIEKYDLAHEFKFTLVWGVWYKPSPVDKVETIHFVDSD
jgi:hypothetical protein